MCCSDCTRKITNDLHCLAAPFRFPFAVCAARREKFGEHVKDLVRTGPSSKGAPSEPVAPESFSGSVLHGNFDVVSFDVDSALPGENGE